MGLDLTVCPMIDTLDTWWLAYDRLGFVRDYALFNQIDNRRGETIRVMVPEPIAENVRFDWYGDEGLKRRTEDPYGAPLTWVKAGEFNKIDLGVINPRNVPIVKFLRDLSPTTPVVLWWH